jgi:arginyl-tRNA synthetase
MNEETAQLLEIKRNYRSEIAELEVAARMKLNAELREKKKELADKWATQLTEKILEKIAASLKPILLEVLREDE